MSSATGNGTSVEQGEESFPASSTLDSDGRVGPTLFLRGPDFPGVWNISASPVGQDVDEEQQGNHYVIQRRDTSIEFQPCPETLGRFPQAVQGVLVIEKKRGRRQKAVAMFKQG